MKIRTKLLISAGLVWAAFLALVYLGTQIFIIQFVSSAFVDVIRYYLAGILIMGVIFSILSIWAMSALVAKRLERLDHQVVELSNQNDITQIMDHDNADELMKLSSHINSMIESIQASREKLEKSLNEQTQELKESNEKLQQELAERQSVEKELIIHKEHLIHLAHYDTLTSLPNRVFFNEMLNKAINHANRHMKTLAILFVDLDRFKNINDALGHQIGDLVLKEVANRFTAVLRAGDVLARLGGDEFIILLNDMGHQKFASPVAEKILQVCAKPIRINAHEFFITASIGICVYPHDGLSLEDLLKNADLSMYKAKHSGGGVFQYYTAEMNNEAHENIKFETSLREAIKNNEFVMFYQPKLNLQDGLLVGVEALIRWDNPELGMMNPEKFLPLAEETGLILQMGEWAIREACRVNKSWQNQGYQPVTISVNISPKQFKHQDIAQLISAALTETGLEAKYLEIEITESAIMENIETSMYKLKEIQSLGVMVSIDDFGTGYTSINYLKQLPVSNLKIDQSFIRGIFNNNNDLVITNAVIMLAHSLGLKVVAEGVETADQLQFLADGGCDLVQGYYLSRPLPEQKIVLQLVKSSVVEGSEV